MMQTNSFIIGHLYHKSKSRGTPDTTCFLDVVTKTQLGWERKDVHRVRWQYEPLLLVDVQRGDLVNPCRTAWSPTPGAGIALMGDQFVAIYKVEVEEL